MATVRTYIADSYVGKNGEAPVKLSFYIKREKCAICCGVSVKVENFDKASGKIKQTEKGYKDKTLIIDRVRARVNDIMVKFRLRNKELTKEAFFKAFNTPDDFATFYMFVDYYQKTHPKELEDSTLDVHEDVINKLQRYAPTLHFDDINEDFILKYKTYLRKELKNAESTTNKNLATIKKYVRAAMKMKYIDENPFEEIKLKRNITTGKILYLTEQELKRLIMVYQHKEKDYTDLQYRALQFFLFMAMTSLHITDARRLRIEQIGVKNFTYYRVKNRNSKPDPIVVPLSKSAKTLIKQIVGKRAQGVIFEKLPADQKINEYIKAIAHDCGIVKNISSKTGRHTFATFYLKMTHDPTSLQKILGHSDIRETLGYAKVLEESKQEGIRHFNAFVI